VDEVRILEIKQSVFANNDQRAELLRRELKEKRIFLLNLMSSPGSGKTTTLTRTIERLRDEFKIGVMEADIDSDVDARTIAATGVKSIQLHTGGMCHLDADMTRQGLDGLAAGDVELAVLENVGNLVCPAEFDTGAVKNAAILSVPEGDDKPLKYPLMFQICDVVLINKTDVLPYFDFDMEKCRENIRMRNPNARVIPICAKTGEGVDEWADWLRAEVKAWRGSTAQRKDAGYERDTFPPGREQTALFHSKGRAAPGENFKTGAYDHRPHSRQAARPDGGRPGILGPGGRGDG